MVLLVLTMIVTIFHSIAYYQVYNVGLVWISEHVDLGTPLGSIPVPWFSSVDPLASILAVPLLIALWSRQAMRGREPSDIGKIGIGAALAAASAGLLALAEMLSGDGKVGALIPLLACTGLGVAFLYYWPPLLALISRAAPAKVNATMMGGAYLTLALSNMLMGWIGSFYEKMTPAAFWTLDAGIAAVGALLVLLFGRRLSRALATC
jgi:POT family proton-dependent oligopeptide transporter